MRIRSVDEINRTLDTGGHNRGLYFDLEQARYAEHIFRVGGRVQRIISEQTGRMIEIKTPTVVLESVFCQGRYCPRRTFCPRSAYLFWREAWLERANETPFQCAPMSHSNRETETMPHENSGEQQTPPEDCYEYRH